MKQIIPTLLLSIIACIHQISAAFTPSRVPSVRGNKAAGSPGSGPLASSPRVPNLNARTTRKQVWYPTTSTTTASLFLPSRKLQLMSSNAAEQNEDAASPMNPSIIASSLASSYAIRIQNNSHKQIDDDNDNANEITWELISLNQWEEKILDKKDGKLGVGALALRALNDCASSSNEVQTPAVTLSCRWEKSDGSSEDLWSIYVDVIKHNNKNQDDELQRELLCVLSRVMIQSAASSIATPPSDDDDKQSGESRLQITLPLLEGEGCQTLRLSELTHSDTHEGIRKLYHPLNFKYSSMEIVDMVNQDGEVLGSLPRPFVHTHNLLHRGIGMIVSKDKSILDTITSSSPSSSSSPKLLPEVYVHQRTSTKRIFPSLYDMFVGGVSSTGEAPQWTAAREVGEELGLKGALSYLESSSSDDNENPLSEKLFQCTVCTSYNRCVVSMFAYTCNTAVETISWQEEEVAWGDFVPYEIVEYAGGMSIDRLVEKGSWPGSNLGNSGEAAAMILGSEGSLQEKIEGLKSKYDNNQSWESWDFVPDGLLVWEAWVNWWNESNEDI